MAIHVGKNGPATCPAQIKCRLKGPDGQPAQHFDTQEEAQKAYDEMMAKRSIDYNKQIEELTQEIKQTRPFSARKPLKEKLKRLEWERDGLTEEEGLAREQAEKEAKELEEKKKKEEELKAQEKYDQEQIAIAKNLLEQEYIPLPKAMERYVINKKWSRHNTTAYRGELSEQDKAKLGIESTGNTGIAMFGEGLYTTTSKAYAKKYGTVRNVQPEEMPHSPLRLGSPEEFNQLEYELIKEHGITNKKYLWENGGIQDYIMKMGYDGITIGEGKNTIIVQYENR